MYFRCKFIVSIYRISVINVIIDRIYHHICFSCFAPETCILYLLVLYNVLIHVQPCRHCHLDNTPGVTVLVKKMAADLPKMSAHQAFAMTAQRGHSSHSPAADWRDAESKRHAPRLPLASTPEFALILSKKAMRESVNAHS